MPNKLSCEILFQGSLQDQNFTPNKIGFGHTPANGHLVCWLEREDNEGQRVPQCMIE